VQKLKFFFLSFAASTETSPFLTVRRSLAAVALNQSTFNACG
jgi:hypothetical protein